MGMSSSRRYTNQVFFQVLWNTLFDATCEGRRVIKYYAMGKVYESESLPIPLRTKSPAYSTHVVVKSADAIYSINCNAMEVLGINVSKCPALKEFYCRGLKDWMLDISKNTVLTHFDCRGSINLTTVYVNEIQLNNIPSSWIKDAHTQYVLKE